MISEDRHKQWNIILLSDKEFSTRQDSEIIEELGSLNFHVYIFDYDNDGFLDILIPNRLESSVGILKCHIESKHQDMSNMHVETE